jgi:hypothetical protein
VIPKPCQPTEGTPKPHEQLIGGEAMLGSTFIYAPDPSRLALIAEDLDALDDFDHVNLDALLSLDFTLIFSSSGVEGSVANKPATRSSMLVD